MESCRNSKREVRKEAKETEFCRWKGATAHRLLQKPLEPGPGAVPALRDNHRSPTGCSYRERGGVGAGREHLPTSEAWREPSRLWAGSTAAFQGRCLQGPEILSWGSRLLMCVVCVCVCAHLCFLCVLTCACLPLVILNLFTVIRIPIPQKRKQRIRGLCVGRSGTPGSRSSPPLHFVCIHVCVPVCTHICMSVCVPVTVCALMFVCL